MMMPRKAALLFAVPALALAACGSSGKTTAAPATIAAVPTTASSSAAASPSASSSTSASPSTSPSPSPKNPAPGAPAVESSITDAGTTFTAPAAATTKKYNADCGSLVDAGFSQFNCVQSTSPGGTIAAFVEVDRTTKEERDLVYKKVGATWTLAQRRVADKGAPVGDVIKSDLNDDGDPKAVFTQPASNQQFSTSLDVIDTSGLVVMHLAINGGFAKASAGGGLEAWYPSSKGGYEHIIVRYLNGKWTVISEDPQSETQAQSAESNNGTGGFSA